MNIIPGMSSRSLWSSQTKQNIKQLRSEGGVEKLVQSNKLSLKEATKLATKAFNSSLVFKPGERQQIIDQLRSELGKQKEAAKDTTEKRLSKTDFFQRAIPFLKSDSAADHKKIEADLNMLEALAENSVDTDLLSSAELELKQIKAAFPKMDNPAEKRYAYNLIVKLDSEIQPDKILNTRGALFKSVRKLLDEQKEFMQANEAVEKTLVYFNKNPGKSKEVLEDLNKINQILDDRQFILGPENYKFLKENLAKTIQELEKPTTFGVAEKAVDAISQRAEDPVQMRNALKDLMTISEHLHVDFIDKNHPRFISLDKKIDKNISELKKKINDENEKIDKNISELKKKISEGLTLTSSKEQIDAAKESYSQLISLREKLRASDNQKMSGKISILLTRINKHPNFKNLE